MMVGHKFLFYLFFVALILNVTKASDEEGNWEGRSNGRVNGNENNKEDDILKIELDDDETFDVLTRQDINPNNAQYLNMLGNVVRRLEKSKDFSSMNKPHFEKSLNEIYLHMALQNKETDKKQDNAIEYLQNMVHGLIFSVVILLMFIIYLMVTIYSMHDSVSQATSEEWEKILKNDINCNDAVVAKFKLAGLDDPSHWSLLTEEDLIRLGFEDHNLIIWKRTYGAAGFSISSPRTSGQKSEPVQIINAPWAMNLRHNIGCSEEAINNFQKAQLTIESEWSKKNATDYALHSMGFTTVAIANFKHHYLKENPQNAQQASSTKTPGDPFAVAGFGGENYAAQNEASGYGSYELQSNDPEYMKNAFQQSEPVLFNTEQLMHLQEEEISQDNGAHFYQDHQQYDANHQQDPNYINDQNYQQY